MALPYHAVHYNGHPNTDWAPMPPEVTCPECGADTYLAKITEGEHEGEWTIRSHQAPGDSHGCTQNIIYDVEAKPRPYYRENGGEH